MQSQLAMRNGNAQTARSAPTRRRLRAVPAELRQLAPLAHVAFCFRCAAMCVAQGANERCPTCGELQPRE